MKVLLCVIGLAGCLFLFSFGKNPYLACAGFFFGGLTLHWMRNEFSRRS